jgi:uncharacterized Zn finger protein
VLATALEGQALSPQSVNSYYTRPHQEPASEIAYQDFWKGKKPLPSQLEPLAKPVIPAIAIRKGGDYPTFWHQNQSFIEVMIEFYERVRKQNKDVL